MAKKNKKSVVCDEHVDPTAGTTNPASPPLAPVGQPKVNVPKIKSIKPPQPSTSALIICRNKHWRYISSFHGPWLQLPPEVLESLANNNYVLPRPRPIDPAVFYDLLKVRKLVEEATTLSVRAASGVTSSNTNGNNSLLGGGGGGGTAKLSKERKHRMQLQATQKLSKAYHLDEIACSVATMQAASTLEDVAHIVLQWSPTDVDAKYVHFFHEKIPSRQLAECTSLQPLDEIIANRPTEGEPLRTRALVKIFKEDFEGAVQDLTSALQVCRYYQNLHKAGRQQLQLASEARETYKNLRWKEEFKLDEEDHPSSLETQLLFQRAGVYLTIACQHVNAALPILAKANPKGGRDKKNVPHTNGASVESANGTNGANGETGAETEETPEEREIRRKRAEARKIVKQNAKRALRDYLSYLGHLDYTPGLPTEVKEEYIQKITEAANGYKIPSSSNQGKVFEMDGNSSLSNGYLSSALVPHNSSLSSRQRFLNHDPRATELPGLPRPKVYVLSDLFSATPPADLPPYPATESDIATSQSLPRSPAAQAVLNQPECNEALTYHPLLTDALHSLLLCHCLIQTSPKELQRHANMVARLARVCDGYPIFQAARSPSRSDWIEIVRRSDNWINLTTSWETLCAPAPLPGQGTPNVQKETAEQKHERLKQQAIMEALEDDRVHDEESFKAAVEARQRRQEEEARRYEGKEKDNHSGPKRWAQDDGKEYPISTDRAQAIVRWIREAPQGGEGTGTKRKKKPASKRKVVDNSPDGKQNDVSIEMGSLEIDEKNGAEKEEVD